MSVAQPAFGSADHAFTLARALGWLGHRCAACSGHEDLEQAPVWFIRRGGSSATYLVVVDLTDTPMPSGLDGWLLQAVNECVRHDRILVCERRPFVMARASAALTGTSAEASQAVDYHHFDATALRTDRT
jgi:hypothetical protein